jgi:SAM-dependent methyltransferase
VNPDAYVEMAATEDRHWWFQARRKILESILASMALPRNARILEVGSGTGGNLVMLARHGQVRAMEMDAQARELATQKAGNAFQVLAGSCPDHIPFTHETFDLICMFDVLEHIDQDVATLAALRKHLAPGGHMLVTVPAYQWLWSAHDVFLHHKRRYTARRLRQVLGAGGLHVDRISYFNTLLLPLAAAARLKDRLVSSGKASGAAVPPSIINASMRAIFASERHLLRHINMPAGVSLLGIARAG